MGNGLVRPASARSPSPRDGRSLSNHKAKGKKKQALTQKSVLSKTKAQNKRQSALSKNQVKQHAPTSSPRQRSSNKHSSASPAPGFVSAGVPGSKLRRDVKYSHHAANERTPSGGPPTKRNGCPEKTKEFRECWYGTAHPPAAVPPTCSCPLAFRRGERRSLPLFGTRTFYLRAPPRREVKNKNHTRKRGREEGGMEDGDTTHSQKRCLVSWCSAMVLVRRGKQTVALHTVEART